MARPGIRHLLEYHKSLPIAVCRAEIHLRSRVDQKWQLGINLQFIAKAKGKTIVLQPGQLAVYRDNGSFIDFDTRIGYTSYRPDFRVPNMSVEEALSIVTKEYRSMFR